MTASALVVGGAGQIGLAASDALSRAGYEVTIAHRGRGRSGEGAKTSGNYREIILDREDTRALQRAAAGRDVLVDVVAYTPEHAGS